MTMNPTVLIFWAAMVIAIGALEYAMPQLTRRDIFFSVTVAPEFRATIDAREILAEYRRGIVIVTLVALTLVLLSITTQSPLMGAALLMLEVLGSLVCFVRAHQRALAHMRAQSTTREASLVPEHRMPGLELLLVGPFIMVICAAALIFSHWDQLPDPMPVHWDLFGNPNGWLPKTPVVVFGYISSIAGICVVMTLPAGAMLYSSRRINSTGAAAREERRFRWVGIAALLAADYLSASTAFLPLNAHASMVFGVTAFLSVIVIVGSLEMVRRGQAGARLAPVHSDRVVSDRTPDECWKWGMFYYNPDDPALIVEKRFGIGWTLNFAHRGAWIFMVLILLLAAGALAMPMLAHPHAP
jgi:uncharacterized membrane protein